MLRYDIAILVPSFIFYETDVAAFGASISIDQVDFLHDEASVHGGKT